MIRTDTVNLTVIEAIAYRQKLTAGGSGVTVLRYDVDQPGIASISKTSGEAIPAANTRTDVYPLEAFNEAIALTRGMPYTKRGNLKIVRHAPVPCEPAPEEAEPEEEVLIDSGEYQKIVSLYTDKTGKLSYDLLNKDLIRFAHASRIVRERAAAGESANALREYIVGNKFRNITGNQKLTDAQVKKMGELLDEVSPKGVFKPLNDELRRMAAANKKK